MASFNREFRAPAVAAMLLAGLLAGCSIGNTEGGDRARPEDPLGFIENVREDVRRHEWQSLLSSSDPAAYQSRVVAGGIPEVQFLAELLGFSAPNNTIQSGPQLDWEDFARIDSISVIPANDTIPPIRVSGTAFLDSGDPLRVETVVALVQGRFVLSPSAD